MNFDAIRLKIASPEDILNWSYGEVTKPETINYRTQRAEKDGLFSERIFGPVKDWECYCGKYRRIRYKGVVCDKCGVEVTRAIVRRERMGHIKLAVPVVHIWFLRSIPSKNGLLLDVTASKLEKVAYYISYIVTAVNETNKKRAMDEVVTEFNTRKKNLKDEAEIDALKDATAEVRDQLSELRPGLVITETDYHNLARRFGDVFEAGTGAEALKKILVNLDLGASIAAIEKELETSGDSAKEVRLLRRLKIASSFHKNGINPAWMIMDSLPVLPPDLRPMVALDAGRYATSDLNDLYRRVINRNNRLKKLMELGSPEIIVINEKRMLQEAVDALIDNSARFGTQQLSSQRRPLRSLADMLKGKQGRFRQNLLGKRVDYSARSVIVVGPHLKIGQCGLPKQMALEIFKPFVINKIIERGLAHNIRNANRLIEQGTEEVWAILEEVIKNRKVLLNRAPTLHRLGMQAFEPVLIEDLAIRIPPLVTTAFNADFDGDQMAVHLPLTDEAQKEATEIMWSRINLLKPATGEPIAVPAQDVVLGSFYLTKIKEGKKGEGKLFSTKQEALLAFDHDVVEINAAIKVQEIGRDIETSVGRILYNNILPADFPYFNEPVTKKVLSRLVGVLINQYGIEQGADILDAIKTIGFKYSTYSGTSWGIDDLVIPSNKTVVMAEAGKEEAMVRNQFEEGLLTERERKARVIEIWTQAKAKLEKAIKSGTLDPNSSVYTIIESGARGTYSQLIQMMGMKGLVASPKGEAIELPVKSSFKEGFTVLEYFISTHGARKGSTDTALKTASAGYLARRLADVCQDIFIKEETCNAKSGIEIKKSDGRPLAQRLFGRTALVDVVVNGETLAKANEIFTFAVAENIEKSGVEVVLVKSPITCKTLYGICGSCYGNDLGNNKPIRLGEAIGIVAAQSIAEPGTQLTMRTFHIGGVAGTDITHGLPRVEELFESRNPKGKAQLVEDDGVLESIEDRGLARIIKIKSLPAAPKPGKKPSKAKEKIYEYLIPHHHNVFFKVGDSVKKGDQLTEGNLDLKELFKYRGSEEVEKYIVNEVQKIYSGEGASISDKHVEVVVKQMFSRVKVKESGDSRFVAGDVVEKSRFLAVNREIKKNGGAPAKALQLLMGITKVALSTESFLSAASFIETAKVLINAACEGKVDTLRGLKENVIIGRLIPVGTGIREDFTPKTPATESEDFSTKAA